MLRELDLVALVHDLPEHGLLTGDVGTVVMVLGDNEAYDVEFVTEDGGAAALLVLRDSDITPIPSAHESRRRIDGTTILHIGGLSSQLTHHELSPNRLN